MDAKPPVSLPEFGDGEIAMLALNLILPTLKKKLRSHPKGFFNWTVRTKRSFTENALEDILHNPANYRLKLVVHGTPYWDGKGYSKLADKLQKYV